jgi:peptidoglycan hydrolase-like protein with peptidoglycan-binding domain
MSKKIQTSVGLGGQNLPANVLNVQYLLNCVPVWQGGPSPELALDGLVGPKTIGAIKKFQTAAFGKADSRVDPGGQTINALLPFDPYPEQPVAPPSAVGKVPGPPGPYPPDPFGMKVPGKAGLGSPRGAAGAPGGPWSKQGTSGNPWGKTPPGKGGAGGKIGF